MQEIYVQETKVSENAAKENEVQEKEVHVRGIEVNENEDNHGAVKEKESEMGVRKEVVDSWLAVRFNRKWYMAKV